MARDPLDRDYTPDDVAAACYDVLGLPSGSRVFEPSVGGGAFVRAAKASGAFVRGVDLDENAPGAVACDAFTVADWLDVAPLIRPDDADAIVGNPPYASAEAHVRAALETEVPVVGFLLRLGFLASQRRRVFWASYGKHLTVHVLTKRPSFRQDGKTDAMEYGFFVWGRGEGVRWL